MRLLADENIPLPVATGLREDGHDVDWVGADTPGIDDRTVLQRAEDEKRILLTFDKDFGTLVFRTSASSPVGILLFRLPPLPKDELVQFVVETVREQDDWRGHFAVIEYGRVRMRPLPNS
jgi:predicted nuclease of predicted toxin-antitoxin system